ncbi:hypothetical protein D9M69_587200 [compost metagenome]
MSRLVRARATESRTWRLPWDESTPDSRDLRRLAMVSRRPTLFTGVVVGSSSGGAMVTLAPLGGVPLTWKVTPP